DRVAERDGLDLVGTVDADDLAVPREAQLRIGLGTARHDLRGAQLVTAVDEGDGLAEPGEEGGLLDRTVTAADHDDLLILEAAAVAGRAPADALAGEGLLAVDAELAVGGSGGDDQRLRPVDGAVLEGDALDVPLEIELDRVLVDDLRAEALGLLLELRHQLRALDALGEPREVLDVRGGHERAAGIEGAGDHDRVHLGARGVDGGGVPGGPG